MQRYLKDVEPSLMEGLELAGKLGASAASVAYSHAKSEGISFESNRLKAGGSSESQCYSVSVVVNHRRGSASGNIPERIQDVVRSACELAKYGAVAHFDEYPEPEIAVAAPKTYSDSVKALSMDRQVEDASEIVERLLNKDAELVTDAGASVSESESFTANTGGHREDVNNSSWGLYGGFQKTTGTDMLFSGAGRGYGELNSFYSKDDILEEMFFDLDNASKIVATNGGVVPLVIPPSVIGKFLSPIASAISGRSVAKGTSPLSDKLHTQCFAKNISILDNPHLDFRFAIVHDSAGIATHKRMLVENGVLNLFLYDYDTACMTGNAPTGNVGCAPYTMLLSPGTDTSASLIKSIKHGIYVKQMLGFGQTNMINGDFSANLALGFLVEDGEIVGRVKNAMISGNIFELLKGEVQFSSDVHPYYLQPYTILPGVSLKV